METIVKTILYKINYKFSTTLFLPFVQRNNNTHSNNIHLRAWRSLIQLFILSKAEMIRLITSPRFVSITVWLPGDRRGTPTSGRYDGVPVPGERHQKHWQREQREHHQQQQQQQSKLPGSPAEAGRAQLRSSETIERRDERSGVHPRAWKLSHSGGQIERSGERGPQQIGVGSEQRWRRDEGTRYKIERWRRLPRPRH